MRNTILSMARVIPGFLLAAALAAFPAAATAAPPAGEHNLETTSCSRAFRVGGASAPVSDLRLTSGHLVLVCKTGSASLVRAGDEVAGVFSRGAVRSSTSWWIRSSSVDAFNLKKGTSLSPERPGRRSRSATVSSASSSWRRALRFRRSRARRDRRWKPPSRSIARSFAWSSSRRSHTSSPSRRSTSPDLPSRPRRSRAGKRTSSMSSTRWRAGPSRSGRSTAAKGPNPRCALFSSPPSCRISRSGATAAIPSRRVTS